jgi:hypothetical protein
MEDEINSSQFLKNWQIPEDLAVTNSECSFDSVI